MAQVRSLWSCCTVHAWSRQESTSEVIDPRRAEHAHCCLLGTYTRPILSLNDNPKLDQTHPSHTSQVCNDALTLFNPHTSYRGAYHPDCVHLPKTSNAPLILPVAHLKLGHTHLPISKGCNGARTLHRLTHLIVSLVNPDCMAHPSKRHGPPGRNRA